jgi:signal transduction histidine kinase
VRPTVASYSEDVREHGIAPHHDVIDIRPQSLFSGRAFLEQRSVFSGNVLRDDPDNRALYAGWNVRAVLASPITSNKRRFGVLTVWSPREPVFAESDLELVGLVARQVAAVLESRALLDEVTEARAKAEMDQLKDRFLASISHDLRNPLTAVGATAQLVRRRLDRTGDVDAERLRASMTAIETSTRQMSGLVDQLLDYARLELGRPLELHLEPVDLVEFTRETVAAHAAASEQHSVVFESAESALVGACDRERLDRVLQNLLTNAIKYSPAGGEIRVDLRSEDAHEGVWAVISVRDQGIGVPAADLQNIFAGFHRGSNVTGRIAGTGIGLATARQVVEQHGGTIRVESVERQGSTFIVRLPLEAPPDTLPDDTTPYSDSTPAPGTAPEAPGWGLEPATP